MFKAKTAKENGTKYMHQQYGVLSVAILYTNKRSTVKFSKLLIFDHLTVVWLNSVLTILEWNMRSHNKSNADNECKQLVSSL